MIRILHLTDFHLNPTNLKDWTDYLKDSLISKLQELNREKSIDIIAFTGDLIDKGGEWHKNKSALNAFKLFKNEIIAPITESLNLSINRFLITPGNHDIVRQMDDKAVENSQLWLFKKGHKYISDFMINAKKNKDYTGIKRMLAFKNFEKQLYNGFNDYKHTVFGSSFKQEINSEMLGICCLNSAWRCYRKNDIKKLLIGEDQLIENTKFISECALKIALVHHPLDWLSDVECELIQSHIIKNFDILLIGHIHRNKTILQTGLSGSLFIDISPAGIGNIRSNNNQEVNGFSVIDYDKTKKSIQCQYFKYNHQQIKFVFNTDVGDEGFLRLKIPSKMPIRTVTKKISKWAQVSNNKKLKQINASESKTYDEKMKNKLIKILQNILKEAIWDFTENKITIKIFEKEMTFSSIQEVEHILFQVLSDELPKYNLTLDSQTINEFTDEAIGFEKKNFDKISWWNQSRAAISLAIRFKSKIEKQ